MKKLFIFLVLYFISPDIYSQKINLKSDTVDFGSYRVILALPPKMINSSKIYTETQEGISKIYSFSIDSSGIILDDTMLKTYKHYFRHYPNSIVNETAVHNKCCQSYNWNFNNLYFREDYYKSLDKYLINLSIIYMNVTKKNKALFDSMLDNAKVEYIKSRNQKKE